jgi:pimeloyl-ACP methyl ester carboxylesterase
VSATEAEIIALGDLKGTFTPAVRMGRRPCAVILPGSGPTDRDGNNPFGVKASPYRLLAEALAAEGIATLRYDKRLPRSPQEEAAYTLDDAVMEAGRWLDWCEGRAGTAAVYLIGHSEGGLIALALARRRTVAGLVLLTTPGVGLAAGILKQLMVAPDAIKTEAATILTRLIAGEVVDSVSSALMPLFRPSVQPFLWSLLALDPGALAAAQTAPLLGIGGGRDLQVPPEDAAPVGGALILPAMNHVLKDVSDDRADNIAAYRDPDRPLATGLVPAIATFMH